jgi:hypothetical protein
MARTWLHGSSGRIDRFTLDFVGVGNDEQGPGLYFTDSPETAEGYALRHGGGHVMTVAVAGRIAREDFALSRQMVEEIIRSSPDLADTLTNFGDVAYEGKSAVMRMAVDAYHGLPLREAVIALSNDFWNGAEQRMLPVLVEATKMNGYTREMRDGETHAIVWDHEAVTVVSTRPAAPTSPPAAADDDMVAEIRAVAAAYRAEMARRYNPDGDNLYWTVGACREAARGLTVALKAAGFEATPVMGTYADCDESYPEVVERHGTDGLEPDFDDADWDGTWKHWWAECRGLIVDVTADQFHPGAGEEYAVVVVPEGAPAYDGQGRSNPSSPGP